MTSIEKEFAHDFPSHQAIFTSRGSAALFLALRCIREEKGPGDVLLPSSVCLSVPLMVHYAGLTPRFCDVEEETFCLSKKTALSALTPTTHTLLAVHLFGKAVPQDVFDWAREKNLTVIEDVAQAAGGSSMKGLLGSEGDFSIFSFDDKKILRGRGGALLVRNGNRFETLKKTESSLPAPLSAHRLKELSVAFRDLSTGFQELLRHSPDTRLPDLTAVFEAFRPSFLYRLEGAPVCEDFDGQRELRSRNYREYVKYLSPDLRYIRFEEQETCWRLPLLLATHDQQLEAIETLRARGVLVSNHYFSTAPFFGIDAPPVSKKINASAINLWVDEKAKDIPWTCETLNAIARA